MTELADTAVRLRALTEFESTLLVEAAAGTGKTALMAGRLTMLLASGAEPTSVAAITFTELAASELSARVHRFIDELLAGRVPEPMPVGPTPSFSTAAKPQSCWIGKATSRRLAKRSRSTPTSFSIIYSRPGHRAELWST